MRNKVVITGRKGKEKVKVIVKRPSPRVLAEAKLERNKAFAEGMKNNLMLRSVLRSKLIEQGAWSTEKQRQLDEVTRKLRNGEDQLKRGGKTRSGDVFTKNEARSLALNMMEWRAEFLNLRQILTEYDNDTVDAMAEEAESNYILVNSILNEDGSNHFDSIDEINRSTDKYVSEATTKVFELVYGHNENWYTELPECQFLIKYKYMNDKGQLINEDGHLVDQNGNLVDDQGRRVDLEGNLINEEGEKLNKDGELEFTEFEV